MIPGKYESPETPRGVYPEYNWLWEIFSNLLQQQDAPCPLQKGRNRRRGDHNPLTPTNHTARKCLRSSRQRRFWHDCMSHLSSTTESNKLLESQQTGTRCDRICSRSQIRAHSILLIHLAQHQLHGLYQIEILLHAMSGLFCFLHFLYWHLVAAQRVF